MSAVAVAAPSFSDRIAALLDRVDYLRADSAADREAIYRLRYEAYLREGALQPKPEARLCDSYDELDSTWTFAVRVDGQLASSIRLHISTGGSGNFPAAEVFPEIIGPELQAGKTIIDPTRFVADATCARLYTELPYVTLRLAYMAAAHFNADYVLATVRSEHQAFYKRIFGHKTVGLPRRYLTLTKPLSLMMLDFPTARDQIIRRYPFFRSTFFERRMLFERSQSAQRSAA
jgi:N-acyl-L-homoserine lactone synthetase